MGGRIKFGVTGFEQDGQGEGEPCVPGESWCKRGLICIDGTCEKE